MIEHVSVPISDYKKSKQLYLEALKPLDYELTSDYPSDAAGFFEGGSTSFWIVKKKKPVQPIHVALRAPSKEAVHQFHSAALKAGAKDMAARVSAPVRRRLLRRVRARLRW